MYLDIRNFPKSRAPPKAPPTFTGEPLSAKGGFALRKPPALGNRRVFLPAAPEARPGCRSCFRGHQQVGVPITKQANPGTKTLQSNFERYLRGMELYHSTQVH